MKTIDDVNIYTWFMERQLSFVPDHFVVSKTRLTNESHDWIFEKLSGRFALTVPPELTSLSGTNVCPAFEDPKEALFYELTFS